MPKRNQKAFKEVIFMEMTDAQKINRIRELEARCEDYRATVYNLLKANEKLHTTIDILKRDLAHATNLSPFGAAQSRGEPTPANRLSFESARARNSEEAQNHDSERSQ